MTLLNSTTTSRRTYFGLWFGGGLAFALLVAAGAPLIGVGVFAVSGLAATGLQYQSRTVLFDERDTTVFHEAGANTIAAVGLSSAVVFPTMTALWALDVFVWPAWLVHLAWFVTGLFALWGLMLTLATTRR